MTVLFNSDYKTCNLLSKHAKFTVILDFEWPLSPGVIITYLLDFSVLGCPPPFWSPRPEKYFPTSPSLFAFL